jgi:hypothetical protein
MYIYGGLARDHRDIQRALASRFAEGLANVDRQRMHVPARGVRLFHGRERGSGHDAHFVSWLTTSWLEMTVNDQDFVPRQQIDQTGRQSRCSNGRISIRWILRLALCPWPRLSQNKQVMGFGDA